MCPSPAAAPTARTSIVSQQSPDDSSPKQHFAVRQLAATNGMNNVARMMANNGGALRCPPVRVSRRKIHFGFFTKTFPANRVGNAPAPRLLNFRRQQFSFTSKNLIFDLADCWPLASRGDILLALN